MHWLMLARSDQAGGEPDSSRENEPGGAGADTPEVDADAIYREIGLYVVLFQSLQDILFQICWFLPEPAYDPDDRKPLSSMTFYELVSETGRRVHAFLVSTDREKSEFGFQFVVRFHALLGRCRVIGRERNRVVHSGFIHLESFDRLRGIVMSDMRPGSGEDPASIENEYLTAKSFDGRQKGIAETALGLSMSKTQLIHWR
jgi:hypothetical protein